MELTTLLTLAWTLVAFVGLVYTLLALQAARKDVQVLEPPPATLLPAEVPILREVAGRNVRAEGFRAFSLGCFLVVGLLVLLASPPVPGPVPLYRWLLTVGLVLGEAGVTANSVLDRGHRRRVIRLALEARKEAHEA